MSEVAWPATAEELERVQRQLAARADAAAPEVPAGWAVGMGGMRVGAVFVATPRGADGPGAAGDDGWAAAVVLRGGEIEESRVVHGTLGAPYARGLLALREGPLLERAVRALSRPPDVLMLNASGRDHPRRAGLAIHLGAVLDVPTLGVTDRPLVAVGSEPATEPGSSAALTLDREVVGYRLRLQRAARPVIVHGGWRLSPEVARELVLATGGQHRTPRPLAVARQLARTARAEATAQRSW